MSPALTRRRTLRGLVCAALVVCGAAREPVCAKDPKPAPVGPRRLVVLILGGGVRASDVLDASRMPTAAALAAEGVVADALASPRANAYLALRDLLTGRADEPEASGRPGTVWPTLFECVRSVEGIHSEDVWFVDAGASDGPDLSASTHASYGATLGARTAHGDGAFGEPLKAFLGQMGRPLPVPEQVWPLLRRLRGVNRKVVGPFLPDNVDSGSAASELVERAVLRELDRKAAFIKAPSPADEKATRAALTLLAVHHPRLLVLRLTGAEVGQQSGAAYFEALRQADEALGRLRAAVAADPALASGTAFAVATETGRNAKLDSSGGLGASEESPSRRRALLLASGPGFKPGAKPKGAVALPDVAPTLATWLGAAMPLATGRVWTECLGP